MKKVIILLIIPLLSCNSPLKKGQSIIEDFPKSSQIEGINLSFKPILLKPLSMCIVDSFLIVSQHRMDTIFSIFHLPDCKLLKCFGNEGNGPNEFNLSFQNVTLGSIYGFSNSTFAVGNHMSNIQYYKIKDILENNLVPYLIEKLPPKLDGFQAITYLSDTMIIGAPYRENMHLFKYRSKGKKLEMFYAYPMQYPLMDSENMRGVFTCYISGRPDNQFFALTYSNLGMIEIYNIVTKEKHEIVYKGFPDLQHNLGLNKDSKRWIIKPEEKVFSWDIEVTQNYIYVKVFNTEYRNISDSKQLLRSLIAEIHVFDWNGKPILKLKPDKFYKYFDVDANDSFLYTLDDNVPNSIRRYDLSSLLN